MQWFEVEKNSWKTKRPIWKVFFSAESVFQTKQNDNYTEG